MTDAPAETGTDIATLAPENPLAVFQSPEQYDALIGSIREIVRNHVPDLETVKGRKAIASLAYKVARTKTALDDAGKELNSTKRAEIEAVDEVRRKMRAELDTLSSEARKPLDEWEAAEEARQSSIRRIMARMDDIGSMVAINPPSSGIMTGHISEIEALEFDADLFREWLEIAVKKKADLMASLRGYHDRAVKAEADAAELVRLRQDAAEREAADAARIAEEARQREAAAKAEADKKAADEAEAKRVADAAAAEEKRLKDIADAAEAARAEERAKADREAAERVAAAEAETERLRRADEARLAAAQAEADEAKRREADTAHKSAVLKSAKDAIMEHGGITEPQARAIVLAIKGGLVPSVTISF